MNLLLLYPDSPEVFFNLKDMLGVLGKKAIVPPLGLLTVAGLFPEHWGLRFVDLRVRELNGGDVEWADCAFLSLTAAGVQDRSALPAIARCKAAGLTVVAGGPGFLPDEEMFGEQKKIYAQVDHFVLNEAEITLPRFLADLAKGTAKREYRTDEWADLSKSPMPRWDLLEFDDYAEMCIQLVRGCVYNCDFCVVPALMGRPGRAKPTDLFMEELQRLYDLGWRGFVAVNDDNLIANVKHAKGEFLPALVRWQEQHGMPFKFHTCVDLRVGEDDELLRLLRDSGFHSVFLGIENLNEACLSEVNKVPNKKKDVRALVETIHRAGVLVYCGLMVGFDADQPAVFQQVMDFVDTCGIIMPSLTKVNAVPGTRLYDRLRTARRVDTSVTPGIAYSSNIRDIPMGGPTLDSGYIRVMEHLWDPERFYQRVKTVLKISPPPKHQDKLTLGNFTMLLRIVLTVGVFSQERPHFWKLFAWTVINKPELLPIFLSAAPLGYGFRKRCEDLFSSVFGKQKRAQENGSKEPHAGSIRWPQRQPQAAV